MTVDSPLWDTHGYRYIEDRVCVGRNKDGRRCEKVISEPDFNTVRTLLDALSRMIYPVDRRVVLRKVAYLCLCEEHKVQVGDRVINWLNPCTFPADWMKDLGELDKEDTRNTHYIKEEGQKAKKNASEVLHGQQVVHEILEDVFRGLKDKIEKQSKAIDEINEQCKLHYAKVHDLNLQVEGGHRRFLS